MASKSSIRKYDSKRTVVMSIRVTHTQRALFKNLKFKNAESALVRVLLNMYFNGRIPEADLLLEHELKRAAEAISHHNGLNAPRNNQPLNVNFKIMNGSPKGQASDRRKSII